MKETNVIKNMNDQSLNGLGRGSIELAWSGRKLSLAADGDIYLDGRKLGTDKEILKGLKTFFTETNYKPEKGVI